MDKVIVFGTIDASSILAGRTKAMNSEEEAHPTPEQIIKNPAHGEVFSHPKSRLIRVLLQFGNDAYLEAEGLSNANDFSLDNVELDDQRIKEIGKQGVGTELVHQFIAMLHKLQRDDPRFSSLRTLHSFFISEAGCRLMHKAFKDQSPGAITFFLHLHKIAEGKIVETTNEAIDPDVAMQKMIAYEIERALIGGEVMSFAVSCTLDLSLVDTKDWKTPNWNEVAND
jgi:hypothetical protein